jgi:GPH family glycoside/pentoside/hexuronide:cation symporter
VPGGATQAPGTLRCIIALFTLFPAACYALSALVTRRYSLRRAEMSAIAAALSAGA